MKLLVVLFAVFMLFGCEQHEEIIEEEKTVKVEKVWEPDGYVFNRYVGVVGVKIVERLSECGKIKVEHQNCDDRWYPPIEDENGVVSFVSMPSTEWIDENEYFPLLSNKQLHQKIYALEKRLNAMEPKDKPAVASEDVSIETLWVNGHKYDSKGELVNGRNSNENVQHMQQSEAADRVLPE